MHSRFFLIQFRRAAMVGAALTALTTAACTDDAATSSGPTAPTAREIDKPAETVSRIRPTVKFRIADTTGAQITEYAPARITTSNADTLLLVDNGGLDLDPAVGSVKVYVEKAATYKACAGGTAHYYPDPWPNPTFSPCASATTSAYSVDLGTVYVQRKPKLVFHMKSVSGAPLLGGAVTLSNSNNWSKTIADGDPEDESVGLDGTIAYSINQLQVSWCETTPPSKSFLVSAKCGTTMARWGTVTDVTFVHEKLKF